MAVYYFAYYFVRTFDEIFNIRKLYAPTTPVAEG